ncbi:MAG TPA: hypothetical protein VHC63_18960 [Acidimicrobiales bacterium]|nr:hypothetical protein [Acidimicrobiales bacterium]
MRRVLGIDVDDALVEKWKTWLAPARQPFFVEGGNPDREMSPHLWDTYHVWRTDKSLGVVWLDEDEFFALPRTERARLVRQQQRAGRGAVPTVRAWPEVVDARAQADGHRFVWWPSMMTTDIILRHVSEDRMTSRHRDVPATTWRHLPAARALAGTFVAEGSGPNCFSTVMAAAGLEETVERYSEREPFDEWLATACRRGGQDHQAGTVWVWRTRDGLSFHAAITLGDGWVLEKPSREWSSPRTVASAADLLRRNRHPGERLERHRLRD